jgi:hypothetical protein
VALEHGLQRAQIHRPGPVPVEACQPALLAVRVLPQPVIATIVTAAPPRCARPRVALRRRRQPLDSIFKGAAGKRIAASAISARRGAVGINRH